MGVAEIPSHLEHSLEVEKLSLNKQTVITPSIPFGHQKLLITNSFPHNFRKEYKQMNKIQSLAVSVSILLVASTSYAGHRGDQPPVVVPMIS